jgi:hypothetical protein
MVADAADPPELMPRNVPQGGIVVRTGSEPLTSGPVACQGIEITSLALPTEDGTTLPQGSLAATKVTAGEPLAASSTKAAYPSDGKVGSVVVVSPLAGAIMAGQLYAAYSFENPIHAGSDFTVGTPDACEEMVTKPKPNTTAR